MRLALLIVTQRSIAAQIELRPPLDGGGFAVNFGVVHPPSGTVIDRVFGARSKWDRDLGAAAYFAHRGFFIGPELSWLSPSPSSSRCASKLNAGDVLLDAGRICRISPRAAICPVFGLGWGWNGLRTDNPADATQRGTPRSFDAAIGQPNTSKTFHRNTVAASIGVGTQIYLLLRNDGYGGERGLFVGVRSGVRLSHDLGAWTEAGQYLSNGLRTALAGPFIQLSLGLAAWSRPRGQGLDCPTC